MKMIRKINNRNCTICESEYLPTSPNQKFCLNCKTLACRHRNKLWKREYYSTEKGKQLKSKYDKKWRDNNKETKAIADKKYAQTPKYKEYHRKYMFNRINNDLSFRIQKNLRKRIWAAIKNNHKSQRTMELLGCNIEEFKKHLSKQFTNNMSWENYGEWHIDHIRPCCSFDLIKEIEQKECFHYTNLQPLWARDNMVKGSAF